MDSDESREAVVGIGDEGNSAERGVKGQAGEGIVLLHERKERAFALYCQGMRAEAIAAALGVSDSSVRRWLNASLRALVNEERAEEAQTERQNKLMCAIESQRAIASAAWDAYLRERAVEEAILRGEFDRVRRRAIRPANGDGDVRPSHRRIDAGQRRGMAEGNDEGSGDNTATLQPGQIMLEEYERPRHASQGARYLAVALAAQREVAHLQGLYDYAHDERGLPDVHITLTRQPLEDIETIQAIEGATPREDE